MAAKKKAVVPKAFTNILGVIPAGQQTTVKSAPQFYQKVFLGLTVAGAWQTIDINPLIQYEIYFIHVTIDDSLLGNTFFIDDGTQETAFISKQNMGWANDLLIETPVPIIFNGLIRFWTTDAGNTIRITLRGFAVTK